jgi:hypothetical protein
VRRALPDAVRVRTSDNYYGYADMPNGARLMPDMFNSVLACKKARHQQGIGLCFTLRVKLVFMGADNNQHRGSL